MESGLVALQSLLNQYFFVLILIGGILFSLHVPKRSHYLLRFSLDLNMKAAAARSIRPLTV